MVIINLVEESTYNKRLSFFKRKCSSGISRESLVINDIVFTLLNLREQDMYSEDFIKFLNINKGRILETSDRKLNEKLSDFIFCKKTYYKRALLSSVISMLTESDKHYGITISDNDFYPFDEYYNLCRMIKSMKLITGSELYVNKFSEKVLYDTGLYVCVNPEYNITLSDINIDFSCMDDSGKLLVLCCGKEMLLYPHSKYFEITTEVSKLMDYGVPLKCACAALNSRDLFSLTI